MYIDPQVPTSYAEDFKQVASAEAPDPHTFRVTYREPYAPALESWGTAIHPRHLLEGKDVTKSPLGRAPVGTGPYRFVEWKAGEKLVLEANPDYYDGKPYIRRVVYRIIPDSSTQFLELQSGGLDFMGLTPIQFSTQTDTTAFRRGFNKYRYLSFGYSYLGYNLRKPLFQDLRVRQAIAHAIDKQELIDGVLLGLGKAATGPYKPDTWVYNPNVKTYPHDPARAQALLKEAGWVDADGDGVRETSPTRGTICAPRPLKFCSDASRRSASTCRFASSSGRPSSRNSSSPATSTPRFSAGPGGRSPISTTSGIRASPGRAN
jgi:peptide/nickel transport system substrate-binding protein